MKEAGVTSGILAAQCDNAMSWSVVPNDEGYKKHYFIGDKPSDVRGPGSTSAGITFKGYNGRIDMLGGGWQNAVYKVTLPAGHQGGASCEVDINDVAKDPAAFTLVLSGHNDHPDCNGRYKYDGE